MNRPSLKSVLAGLFIVFQLVYLPAANLIQILPLDLPESTGELSDDIQLRGRLLPAPVQKLADAAGTVFIRWGELTGQTQGWSLFAPHFGHQASLPAVSFAADGQNDSNMHLSRFLPTAPDAYFRLPDTWCRLFNYEYRLTLLYWTWSPESQAALPAFWREAALQRAQRQQKSLAAYMKWRARTTPAFGRDTISLYAKLVGAPLPDSEAAATTRMRPRSQSIKPIARLLTANGGETILGYDLSAGMFIPLNREP